MVEWEEEVQKAELWGVRKMAVKVKLANSGPGGSISWCLAEDT